uniref:Calponin-homology (CH) domain-containing protein n=1 Tax=Globodera rostochiensis TaxID=31243 RepID=A0A914HWA3_GLORO
MSSNASSSSPPNVPQQNTSSRTACNPTIAAVSPANSNVSTRCTTTFVYGPRTASSSQMTSPTQSSNGYASPPIVLPQCSSTHSPTFSLPSRRKNNVNGSLGHHSYQYSDAAESECLEHYESNLEKYKDERDAIQKKTFTKWVNQHLIKNDRKVEDLFMDLRDGFNLIVLLEALTDQNLHRENGSTRFHRIQNVQSCLESLRRRNVKLVNIRPEDIVEGNGKLTLGLIWTIILNFQVSMINQRRSQQASTAAGPEIGQKQNAFPAANQQQSRARIRPPSDIDRMVSAILLLC